MFVQNNIYYKYENLSKDYHRAQHEYNIYDDKNNLIHKYLFNKDTFYDKSLDSILYTNEDFCICFKKNYKKIKINLQLHRHNRHGFGSFNLEIDENNDNYININCVNDQNALSISTNTGLIETNTSNISSNKDDIIALQNSNVKAFYNLDKIFIYDIDKGYETVNKHNHFHIFEKEITYNFIKNSYLEIALKVLTEISNYVLIGYFQILCNFYDQDNNLFYTISLSTAMGSINKLSTIKSVFIVPINEHMSKIKIDFFIAPKPTQQNRSAKFIIQDINSNKIYIKYFQKTDEMSIKNIQDSLSKVNDIKIYLKNLFNIIYHKNDIEITHIFFEKTFLLNAKKDDLIEIDFKMLILYENTQNSKHITTNFIIYDENNIELLSMSYDNIDFLSNSNTNILLKNNFSYNFNKDVNKVRILISFTKRRSYVSINYIYDNNKRLIIKHYGN